MAPGSTHNLAVTTPLDAERELDLSLLMQAAPDEQKIGWEQLTQLLRQALLYRCDQITIEPDKGCWRTRFFASDRSVEQIESELSALQQLSRNFIQALEHPSGDPSRLRSVLAQVDQKRYLLSVKQLPCVDGTIFNLTIDPWQPMPSSLDELQLPASIDRRVRQWLAGQGGWLSVAGPSNRLNTRGQLAVIQAMTAPDVRLLYVARDQRYSLPRVNQLALQDFTEQHRELVWQQAMAMSFDGFVLDGVRDGWLQSLANISDRESSVVHTINADNTTNVTRRLQALQLNQSRFSLGRSAVLMQYPARLQCEHCKCPDNNTQSHQAWLNDWLEPDDTIEAWINPRYKGFMAAPGCEQCDNTGLAGWTTIYEWLEFNEEIKSAIKADSWQTANSLLHLQQTAVQSIFKLARQGSISLSEAKRVLGLVSHQLR